MFKVPQGKSIIAITSRAMRLTFSLIVNAGAVEVFASIFHSLEAGIANANSSFK